VVFLVSLLSLNWIVGCLPKEQPAANKEPAKVSQPVVTEPNTVGSAAAIQPEAVVDSNNSPVKQVCTAICKGDFAAAGKLLEEKKFSTLENTAAGQLKNIVSEYEKLEQQRQKSKEQAYSEQLKEFEKFRKLMTAKVNDVNEANDIPKVLLVVVKTEEFANERQKQELLADSFVNQTIEKAKKKAAKLESEGKWLDSYISC
jgi:hypothetical protein